MRRTAASKSRAGKRWVTIGARSSTRSETSPTTRDHTAGVGDAADQRHVLADEQVGGQRQGAPLARDPQSRTPGRPGGRAASPSGPRPARPAVSTTRSSSARAPACRRPRGRRRWRRAAERARAPPGARHRRRSARATCSASSAIASEPSVPTPITPTASPGRGRAFSRPLQDDRGRLDEHPRVEGDVVGEAVHDPRGDGHELRVAPGAREPERLDVLAPLRLAAPAAAAAMARDHALADDAIAHAAATRRPPPPRRSSPPTRARG